MITTLKITCYMLSHFSTVQGMAPSISVLSTEMCKCAGCMQDARQSTSAHMFHVKHNIKGLPSTMLLFHAEDMSSVAYVLPGSHPRLAYLVHRTDSTLINLIRL